MLQCESFNLIGWLGLAEGPYYFSSKVSPAKCGDQSHQGGGTWGEEGERRVLLVIWLDGEVYRNYPPELSFCVNKIMIQTYK